jgi:hypothetical protein
MDGMMAQSGMEGVMGASREEVAPVQVEETAVQAELATGQERQAVALVSVYPVIADFIASYPGWTASAYADDEAAQLWHVDFAAADGEWLGYGHVNLQSGEIYDVFVPRDLTPEEFQAGQEKIEHFLLNNPEVMALLGDVSLWDHNVWYNRWDANWQAWYGYGLDEWTINLSIDAESGNVWMDDYYDPAVLEEDEQVAWNRDQAVELAYQAEGLEAALNGHDEWHTYASDQGDGLWTVEFATDGELLFSALVDIVNWQVVEGIG